MVVPKTAVVCLESRSPFFQRTPDTTLPPHGFELTFPIMKGSFETKLLPDAIKFLRLPTWSYGYYDCHSNLSEVSCFEVVRAYKAIKQYEQFHDSGTLKHSIYIKLGNQPLQDKMSMIYYGMVASIRYKRRLVINQPNLPFQFPKIVEFASEDTFNGPKAPISHLLTCFDFSPEEDVIISGFLWPQVLYVNHPIAEYLRETFSYHAAYFLGNYLFGTIDPPANECRIAEKGEAIEGWRFPILKNRLPHPSQFPQYLVHCNVTYPTHIVSNDPVTGDGFKSITVYNNINESSTLCSIRKLISSFKIHQTFGSRVGFWSNALQGTNGTFFNTIDKVCVPTLNSQASSIWHTYCKGYETPKEPVPDIYPINDYFYVCGPNSFDARLYLEYLLW